MAASEETLTTAPLAVAPSSPSSRVRAKARPTQVRAAQVDPEHAVPGGAVDLGQRRDRVDAGGGDEQLRRPAEQLRGARDGGLDLRLVLHVGGDLVGAVGDEVERDDAGTLLAQQRGGGGADARRRRR